MPAHPPYLLRHLRGQPSPILSALAPSNADRILLALASAGLINLIVGSIVTGVVFIQLPTAMRPPAAGAAGFVGAWLIGVLPALALGLWLHLRAHRGGAES